MNSRAVALDKLLELREELKVVRDELTYLNGRVESGIHQRDLENMVQRVEQSFESIVPESRLSAVAKRRRKIAIVYKLAKPILSKLSGNLIDGGIPVSDLFALAETSKNALLETEQLVDRTVTAKKFSQLLHTENMQFLSRHLLSNAEVDAIESSLRR